MVYPELVEGLFHVARSFTVSATAGVSALGIGAAGYAGAHTILDGDGLHHSSLRQCDGLFILQALVGRDRAVKGVEDAGAGRTTHGHLSRFLKLGVATEVRSIHGRRYVAGTAARAAIAGVAARITAASLS